MPEIKTKADKRGWDIDRLKEIKSDNYNYLIIMFKVMKSKQGSRKDLCNSIVEGLNNLQRDITNLINEL